MATRNTDIMTISVPVAMAREMEVLQKKEHRTRSELLREAWRMYFESRFPVYMPTKAERAAINKGRAELKRGQYVTLSELMDELGYNRNKISKKGNQKVAH